MKLDDAIAPLNTLFLHTAPVICYVECSPQYFEIVQPIFRALATGQFEAVPSPITLAECLVIPMRDNNRQLQQDFSDILIAGQYTTFFAIDAAVSHKAAELRNTYEIKLPDALPVAVAMLAGCTAFLTNDARLRQVRELTILVLDDLEH